MKRKKGEAEMRQEAIDKASQLISLLQKQNRDIKKKFDELEYQCEMLRRENRQLLAQREEVKKKFGIFQEKYVKNQKELEENREAFQTMQESLKKRIHTNKELHQKISLLNAKLKQKTRECNEERTKLLSLENENEYLIKRLEENEGKQNMNTQKINVCNSDRENQLKEAIRLKQAFARRCEELKADNHALTLAAAEYKQQVLDCSTLIEVKPQLKHVKVVEVPQHQPPPPPPPPQPVFVDNLISKLIREKLGIDPERTVEQQYDQLSTFLEYRLAHLDKIWQGINSKIQPKQKLRIQNLKDLQSACQRMYVYVNELVSNS